MKFFTPVITLFLCWKPIKPKKINIISQNIYEYRANYQIIRQYQEKNDLLWHAKGLKLRTENEEYT